MNALHSLTNKWIFGTYGLVLLACVGFVLSNREPGLGMAGIVVLALAVAVLATVVLGVVLLLRRRKR